MGGTTHKLRPSPYLLQVMSQTLFFPVKNYSLHTFCSKRIPESHNLTPVFNIVKLTLAPEDPIQGQQPQPPPPPKIIDEEEEWVVEKMLDSRVVNRKLQYLIKWEGFRIEHNSWESWDDIHAPDLVANFHQKHSRAPQQIQLADYNNMTFHLNPLPVVPGHHSLEEGVDVRGHPSKLIPIMKSDNPAPAFYIPPHCRRVQEESP